MSVLIFFAGCAVGVVFAELEHAAHVNMIRRSTNAAWDLVRVADERTDMWRARAIVAEEDLKAARLTRPEVSP